MNPMTLWLNIIHSYAVQKWQLKVVVKPRHLLSLVFGHDILVPYYIDHNIQGLVHSITIPIALLIITRVMTQMNQQSSPDET